MVKAPTPAASWQLHLILPPNILTQPLHFFVYINNEGCADKAGRNISPASMSRAHTWARVRQSQSGRRKGQPRWSKGRPALISVKSGMNNLDDMLQLQNCTLAMPPFEDRELRKSSWDLVNRTKMLTRAAWLRCSLVTSVVRKQMQITLFNEQICLLIIYGPCLCTN